MSMFSAYLAILIFILVSLFIPASLLIGSKLLRPKTHSNKTSIRNFESGEESIDSDITVMNEYLHYFSSFLAFEIIAAILIIWAIVQYGIPNILNIKILLFSVFAFIFQIFIFLTVKFKE